MKESPIAMLDVRGAGFDILRLYSGPTLVVSTTAIGVGIFNPFPFFALHVNGSAGKPGGGSWADSSDVRLKKNISELDSREALDKLLQLKGVTYEWENPEEHEEGEYAGITAQNLEEVFPEWVIENEPQGKDKDHIPEGGKAKAISFPHDFNAYLIEALREQQNQIEELRAEIERMKLANASSEKKSSD